MLNKRAQTITEYAVLLGFVAAALVATQIYMGRAVKAKFKASADSISTEQFTTNTTAGYTIETRQISPRKEVVGGGAAFGDGKTSLTEWTKSTIAGKGGTIEPYVPDGAKIAAADVKDERTTKDYVTASPGGGALGTHGTFDSDKLSDKKIFEDD